MTLKKDNTELRRDVAAARNLLLKALREIIKLNQELTEKNAQIKKLEDRLLDMHKRMNNP